MRIKYNKAVLTGTGFYFIITAGLFLNTFTTLASQWRKDDFSYCYLVPFIVIYLIWEKKEQFFAVVSKPSWKGLPLLCLGIIFFWIGELGGEYFTLYLSFWLIFVGLCWLHLGLKKIKIICFPLFFILTMFPPPNFIYQKISVNLKLISSQLGVFIMQLFGMSAYREGNVIDLGFTQLQVVDACSGLRYLFPLMMIGLLLAYFYKNAFWKKVLLVISTIPISIAVNGLRIASVGMLYPVFGPKVAEGFFHDFSGWFIFMVSTGMLLAEMWILKRIGRKWAETEKDKSNKPQITQSDADYKGRKNFFFQPQFIVAILLLGATWGLSQGVEFREKIPINKSFDQFPVKIGKWIGKRQGMEQKFIDELDLSDYVIMNYKNKHGESVNFYVAYYESQRKGESIHSPATCLPSGGWIFKQAGAVKLPFKLKDKSLMSVNRALMEKSGTRQLLYYWFPQRGRILTNAYQLKFFAFWDALTRQRTDGALVRVMTPVDKFEKPEVAEKRLQGFVKDILPVLDEYLPD